MKKSTKFLLSVPSVLMLLLIPVNFFADLPFGEGDLIINIMIAVEVPYLAALIYMLIKLWKNPNKTKSEKWTWTLLTLLVFGPVTVLIYLWNIEADKNTEN